MKPETPAQTLDRKLHVLAAPFTASLSPVSLALAWADWAWHLAASPGRQIELARRAGELGLQSLNCALGQGSCELPAGETDDDPRFRAAEWAQWPFNVLRQGFRQQEQFWHEAANQPGMSPHHVQMTRFFARQWLGLLTPANGLFTNPVVLKDALESGGAHLLQGAQHWLNDLGGRAAEPEQDAFQLGRDVAVTPGQVVMRNHFVELLRYDPQTPQVHPEPVLIVPSWIMKYYILDLSPHNSLVRWLVAQGHTVYMLSWRNPDAEDAELSMDDYLEPGVFEPLRWLARHHRAPVHLAGYCLGGTLAAIAAAAAARGLGGALAQLASLTLFAAQTDFSEPGELGLFIDESQVGFLDAITREQGYLSGSQMAGSFQFLHSRELVWTRRMREYLMGEREQGSDLMAWNADTTRLPARMHHQYLTALYLRNALAIGRYRVQGQPVSLSDLHLPVFMVGTERDHISPWHSVYKLHHLCEAETTFVLAAGGHNAGIVSEPGHPHRHYRIAQRAQGAPWIAAEAWPAQAELRDGSWWPAWAQWLQARSGKPQRARPLPASGLGAAPGEYVLKRYAD